MKNPSKYFFLLLALVSLITLAASPVQAQVIIYNFGVSSASGAPSTDTIDNLSGSIFPNSGNTTFTNGGTNGFSNAAPSSGYAGASGDYGIFTNVSQPGTFNASTSTYTKFTLTPDAGYSVLLTGLSFGARIANVPATPTSFSVYTSADGFASSIGTLTLTKGLTYNLYTLSSLNVSAAIDTPLEVRIYFLGGDGASQTGGTRLDDLTITAQAVPEPSAVILAIAALAVFIVFRRRQTIL